jgi:hypothetical protein
MQIWSADFLFEYEPDLKELKKAFEDGQPVKLVPKYYEVNNVVALKLPADHIHRKSDIVGRALKYVPESIQKILATDWNDCYKVKIVYKKFLGRTCYEQGMD